MHTTSIIFKDELIQLEAQSGRGGGDSEVQRTMLELLNQFEPTKNINHGDKSFWYAFLLSRMPHFYFTNRYMLSDIFDPEFLRPGRIDRKIEFPPVSILHIHSWKVNIYFLSNKIIGSFYNFFQMSLQRGVNLRAQWLRRWGNVPVLKYAVSVHCTAGMYAHRERRQHMTQEDFEFAVAKVRHISFSLSNFFCGDYIYIYYRYWKKNQDGNTSVNKPFS